MYGKEFEAEVAELEARYPPDRRRAALLEALHACQRRAGFVTEEAMAWLAQRYSTSTADIRGVVSFYTMYFTEHPGQHVIWLCRTFSCQLLGAGRVMEALQERLGCSVGETDPTGTFRIRWMECLAACDKAPCALVDDEMFEHLTPESVPAVLDHVASGGKGARVVTDRSGPRLVPLDVHAAGA